MASFKQVTLKDPTTGDYLSPRVYGAIEYEVVEDGTVVPPYTNDADSLGGKPAEDYVTKDTLPEQLTDYVKNEDLNNKLQDYTTDEELQEALSGIATKAFEPYEGEEPPETLETGKGIITTDDRLYVGSRSNKPIEVVTLAHELNIGTINGKSMEDIIDYLTEKFVENKIGNVGKYDGVITGDIALGNYVDMGGYTWRVSHIDNAAKEFYLTLNTVTETTPFGGNKYAGSTIAGKCSTFMGTMPATVINLLKMKTVNGVTAKVFIASNEQMNGGFDFFSDNASRIAYDGTGKAVEYWTSSPDDTGGVRIVNTSGHMTDTNNTAHARGFRPSVCLAL